MSPKPRRIILDLFGDYLRFRPDSAVRLGHLTTLLGAFGVAPATVRMTMSRLRREGWFTSRRDGRETVYALTPSMLEVLDEGRSRIFDRRPESWSGMWTMLIYHLTEDERQEREQLRKDLVWQGFGPLSTSTWLAPGDRRKDARRVSADLSGEQVEVLRCLTDGIDQDRALAERCWELGEIGAAYSSFLDEYRPLLEEVGELDGPSALVQRTYLISSYRHFPYRDPGLPPELAPAGWPGQDARSLFARLHEELGPAARGYVSEVIGAAVDDTETAG